MLPTPPELKGLRLQLRSETLDFDLAMFTTYAQMLKQNMKFVFQSILYRLFRSERLDKVLPADY